MSFFIMKKFTDKIIHLEAADMVDAVNFMIDEYGCNWTENYMLFEGKRID